MVGIQHNAPLLHIEGFVYPTEVNGPGKRVLLAVRGCSLHCPGCVNKSLWDKATGGRYVDPALLVDEILRETGLTREEAGDVGITISGAEPMDQSCALFVLLALCKLTFKSVIVFTGYTIEEIRADHMMLECMSWLDAAVTGRYDHTKPAARGLRGSTNQEIIMNEYYHVLNKDDLENFEHQVEAHPNGLITGFPPQEEKDVSLYSV